MHYPHITIVTPSFNQAPFLEAAIDSVLSQNYPNLRYIVIDGHSLDGSREIIERHARHLHYWTSEKDDGQPDAINKGFARAPRRDGQLFAFLNSDDLYTKGALQRVRETYLEWRAVTPREQQGQCWFVGDVENFGEGVAPFITRYPREKSDRDRYFWFYANPVHQPGSFWSAELFERFGPFDTSFRYVFDYDFFMRLRFLGNIRPIAIAQTLARFRLHEASKTVAQRPHFEPEFQKVRRIIAGHLSAPERRQARIYVRQTKADRLQVAALDHLQMGKRSAALSHLARSLWHDPRLLWQRRTAGALKRFLRQSLPVNDA